MDKKEKRKLYMREYYEKHKEKLKQYARDHKKYNADYYRQYYIDNKKLISERHKKWYAESKYYEKNKSQRQLYGRNYCQTTKYKERRKELYRKNPTYYCMLANIRKTNKKAVNDIKSYTDKIIFKQIVMLRNIKNKITDINWDIDHIIPIKNGGRHTISNLQVVPSSWNRSKQNRNDAVYFIQY